MSRVHDALRKAAQDDPQPQRRESQIPVPPPLSAPPQSVSAVDGTLETPVAPLTESVAPAPESDAPLIESQPVRPGYRTAAIMDSVRAAALMDSVTDLERLDEIIRKAPSVPFDPLPEALLINPAKPRATPGEEFRTLRTRLNHLQTLQPLHSLVITSPSPAEGKSFTAMNLAVAQAQLAEKRVLLADFDFRRPTIDKTFRVAGQAGITDYLQGRVPVSEIISRIADSNLYLMTAGGPVANPLELLNLKECRALMEAIRNHFDWVIIDTPPLLFAADANLLSTMSDGSVLVVRIGSTTFDAVSRAMQSLCENNVLGVVVNGARHGELYSNSNYYHDYYYSENLDDKSGPPVGQDVIVTSPR